MTGLDMGHAEVRGNKQDEPFGQIPLSKNTLTVAEILQKAGYKTGLIGKWGLGIENTTGEPNKMGFDFYYGYLDQVLAHNSNPEYLLRNGKKEYLNNEVNYLSKDDWHKGLGSYATKKVDHSHELFENETLKFIVENKNDPFFLYLPYIIPHDNGEALLGNRIEISDQGIYKDKDWENDHKNYAAAITRLDETVGKILQSLKENKLDKNTIVIFTSDNGPEMNYDFTDFFDSNGELKGGKRDLYEGGIRVPFIAWFPDKIKPGVSDHLSAFWDFLPSAAELAGAQMPEQINGLSYTPTLFGKSDEQKQHDQLYWEFPEQGKKQAIIVGDWKLHHFVNENRYELYNLSEDISEKENLIESNPQKFHALKTKMENARTESIEFPL
jgi:arylsulfatase A-like enzyme